MSGLGDGMLELTAPQHADAEVDGWLDGPLEEVEETGVIVEETGATVEEAGVTVDETVDVAWKLLLLRVRELVLNENSLALELLALERVFDIVGVENARGEVGPDVAEVQPAS